MTLLSLGVPRTYAPGEPLMREGEDGGSVVLILTGYVKVAVMAGATREALLGLRRAGEIVGEMAAVGRSPRSATVTAAVAVTGRLIGAADFQSYLGRTPEAAAAVIAMVADRLRAANHHRRDLMSFQVRVRVARTIRALDDAFGRQTPQGRRIDVVTQREFSDLVGAAEPSVQRVLRDFNRRGIILWGYGWFVVLRRDLLDAAIKR